MPHISNLDSRTYLLVDPTEREERVMDGLLVIAMNKHHEICTIQSSGVVMLLQDQVNLCLDQSFWGVQTGSCAAVLMWKYPWKLRSQLSCLILLEKIKYFLS